MEYQHGYYPRWLKRDLVGDFFPWEQAQTSSMPTFLEHYTLHDSILVGVWLTDRAGLLVVVQWDPVWVNFEEERAGGKEGVDTSVSRRKEYSRCLLCRYCGCKASNVCCSHAY